MDWIFDNFQIVVLIAVVIGSLAKRILEAKAAGKESRDEMPDEGDIFEPDEEWMLPQAPPQPSVPPPLVRQTPPPLVFESPPRHSREHEAEVILKRQKDMQERLRQIKESRTNTTGGASETRARVAASQSNARALQPGRTGIRQALRSPREIRRAVIMREILGPPVGLR